VGIALEQRKGAVIHALMMYEFLVLYPVNPKALIWLSLVKSAKSSRPHHRESSFFRMSVFVHRSFRRHDVLATVDAADIRGLGTARLLCVAELPHSRHGHISRS
jgi:hypothetical protein